MRRVGGCRELGINDCQARWSLCASLFLCGRDLHRLAIRYCEVITDISLLQLLSLRDLSSRNFRDPHRTPDATTGQLLQINKAESRSALFGGLQDCKNALVVSDDESNP